MTYRGDFPTGATVRFGFSTAAAAGSRVAFSASLEAADILIYKDGADTQRASDAGVTVTSAFDSLVGVHMVTIDLSDNTDAGFYAAGHDYTVVLYPDETVDSLSVAAIIAEFSIENRWPSPTASLTAYYADPRSLYKGTGTAAAGGLSSITLATGAVAALAVDAGDLVACVIDGVLDAQVVESVAGDVCTMESAWKTGIAPDANDPYYVFAGAPGLSSATIAAAVAAHTLGAALASLTVEQLLTKLAARILGNNSGLTAGAGTVVDKDLAGTDAVSQAVDADGNRSTLDLTP